MVKAKKHLFRRQKCNGIPGDSVFSPVDGIIKEATHHGGGYAGTVVIEFQVLTPTGIETNTAVGGHMNYDGPAYPGLQVKAGQRIKVGTLIGYLADQAQIDRWNSVPGQFGSHFHWGIRKGAYVFTDNLCQADYQYPNSYALRGYTSCTSVLSQWHDPMTYTLDRCVGCYDDEAPWHNDGSSQAFLDAYIRAHGFGIGSPAEGAGNPNGTKVHCWLDLDPNGNNQCTGIYVQNFENSDP